jgi:pimeloyl-ACP methyl ester carboxylesterase
MSLWTASVPGEFFAECVDASVGVPGRVWRAALDGMIEGDDSGELGRVGCPTLVVGGAEDTVFRPTDQAAIAAAIPGGRLKLYAEYGHTPHWEVPDRFADGVAAFLSAG